MNLKQEEFVTTLLTVDEAQAEEQVGTVSQGKNQIRAGLKRLRILNNPKKAQNRLLVRF